MMPRKRDQNNLQMKHEKEGKGEIENERKMALVQLQEMFSNQLEPEVVSLILSECEFNVDEALEKLFTISSDVKCDAAKSLLSQESHNHHEDVTGIHSDEKSAVSSIATLNPTAPSIKSSQSLSNNENMSGLPNFPSLEVFGVGDLGAFSVYNDRPKVQNSWENGRHVEPSLAKHVQNDFKVNLTEMNSPKKTQSESQMSDTRESRYTFINVTSDDPVMPSSKQLEHAIPMKQEDSNLSKKTDEKGNQLMVIDESTSSFNSFVQNGSKRLIEPNETVKQDEIRPINDTDLQVFNQFVKQISREGPERSDWTKHTKGDYPRNRASREHLSFENCNRQGGNILMMPGHAGAVSHGFPTRMDPRVPFGKLPPDISKQQPFNFSHFEGLMPFTEKQNVHPITWSPFFQQQGFKPADAMPIPFCTGVNFPRNKNVVSTSGIRTQIPQWRLQRPELRMPTYPRKKYPPQQRVDCSSHTNVTPQNHGNYGAQDQTNFQYNKKLILMRGLPGSGKSTLACKLKGTHGVVLSSDDFFHQNGRYVFDASLLGEAHEWNQSRARRAMEGGMSPIVIDNTNTQAWEMKPYVSLGSKYGYEVEFKEPNTPWQWNVRELARRNQHEVGEATISRMLDRYQHKMSITTVMNSRKPEFSQPVRENNKDNERIIIADCSKTNKKEVTIVSDVELPKEQRLRQSRNRRKHQEETTVLPVEFPKVRNVDKDLVIESESDLGVCLKDDTESLLHVDESERKLSFCVANKSENESEDVSSDDVNKRSIPRPQRTATRMRKCRERPQSPVHEGTKDTTMKKDEINEKKSSFTSIDNEALQDTLSMRDDASKSPGTMLAFKETNLINKTPQHPHIIESEQKVSTGCVKSSETDQQNSRLSGDFYSESSLLSDPSFQQEHRVPEIFGNEGYCKVDRDLFTLTSSVNHKRAAGIIEMENSKLKSVKASSQDRLSVTSGDQSPEHALSSNSEDNILKGSEMEDSSCDECLPTQSEIAPPLPQLLASLTNSKRTSQEQKQLNHKIPQSNFSKAQDVQKSNFETLSNSSTYDSAEMDKSSNSTSVEKSSLDYQASTVVEGSCLKGDEAITTNDSETYNFLKTCFPAVDIQVIKDMLATYGEEAVPKIVDSLLSLDTFQDKEEFEEPYNRSSQSPDQVCSQGKSEDSMLHHVQVNAPENSRSQFDSQANPVNTANIPLTSKVPTFSNLSSVDLAYNHNPDQTSSVKTLSMWQLGASVSNERNTMELGSMSDDSITLKPEGKNLFTASGNMGQALNLQKESANPEKMQNENICSLSDSSLPLPSRPSNRREKSAESDPGRLNKSSSPVGVKGKVQWLDNLYLTLEPALALQLVEIFGSIHGLQSKGGIAEKDLTVKLDVKLAKTLYERWKETVQECRGVGNKGLDEQKEEIVSSTKSKPLLQQIMEEERVAELSLKQQAESNGSSSTEGSVAAMLKRQKLYDLFPGVNRIALDELFKANRYELQPTVQTVKMSCNLQEEPRNVVASGPIPPPQNPQELPSVDLTDDVRKSTFEKNAALMESMLSSASSEEGSYQALDDPGYADYRAEASMHARQRDDCFKKAALAFSKKQGALAQIYAQQGHQHTQKLKEANWRAAKKILQSRNCNRDDNTIDLHGLHVSEALCALEELLLVKTDCDTKCVTVVTGRGSHSKGGKARIKPAVLDYLVRNNFRFEEINQGLLKVYL